MKLASAADAVNEGLGAAGSSAGFTTNLPLTTIVANVINALLGITGILFVCLLVYAGILYLTAGGVDDNIKKAKRLISSSVIGIIIIIASYALAKFVFAALEAATTASLT